MSNSKLIVVLWTAFVIWVFAYVSPPENVSEFIPTILVGFVWWGLVVVPVALVGLLFKRKETKCAR